MSAWTVARTTLLRASRRPSTYAIGALAFFPAVVGALSGYSGNGALAAGGPVAIGLVAPLLVAAMVAGPVGESYEQRTVVYWFTRPFRREMVLVGETLGFTVVAAIALALSGSLLAVANALTGTADLSSLARVPLGMALQAAALVGFSVACGTMVPKHPVLTALALLLISEGAFPRLWSKLAYLSFGFHTSVITGMPFTSDAGALPEAPSLMFSAIALIVFGSIPLLVAMATVRNRDLT
jgi:ABC-type transport system involved in multi-copper enzyme maturation permease subunit